MRTRIKICGITQPEHALACARLGADAIGLVFYAQSPRAVNITTAKQIIDSLPAFVTTVGLFVNPSEQDVKSVLNAVPLDCLQFHGDEEAQFCNQFGRPYIKAIRMQADLDLKKRLDQYPDAQAFLLDSYVQGVPGGTGETFDWTRVPAFAADKIILAGGLQPENVAMAIRVARPYAVDVSGGVEKVKGVKDPDKIRKFINEVNRVGSSEI